MEHPPDGGGERGADGGGVVSATNAEEPAEPRGAPEQPTPSEMVNLAMQLRPDKMRGASESDREDVLAEAFNVWKLAREILARSGKTSDEAMRAEVEKDDAARDKGAKGADVLREYPISEAARSLGYKDTRGVRSFFDLVAAAEKAGALANIHLSGGLATWIRDCGKVDDYQLSILKQFKSTRDSRRHRAGGLAKAAKSAVK